MLSQIFHVILYQPLFNIFVFLYNIIPAHDVGITIILLTLLVRLVLWPLTSSSIKSQRTLQEMQPKMNEIKKKFANDKQAQAQATMELYKTTKVHPLASCLPTLLQLPILIALYLVLRDGLASSNIAQNLYSFIGNPGTINPVSFGIFNLSQASIVLAVLAGVAQFFQAKTLSRKSPPKEAGAGAKDEDMMSMMNKQMLYLMPLMTILIGSRFPAGLTLYWFFSTLLMVLQQLYVNNKLAKAKPPTTDTKPPSIGGNVIEGEIIK